MWISLAVEKDLAAFLGVDAEDRPRGFRTPCAHQTGHADDFARVKVEVDVAHETPSVQVADFQDLLPRAQVTRGIFP